ncbi:GAF domain-containing protein [Polyangium sorediatum]|uniref:GAF domain-containing protein n=1 Tax=Polyangium sorediatum TaxID=889274 RepID=A0ABT6P7L4_9BACT|nr:GAF domain-containing protein [Polyangium sorediatum]MDI1436160.1 GAF domain-containing protein [Polyangium sorediatum]
MESTASHRNATPPTAAHPPDDALLRLESAMLRVAAGGAPELLLLGGGTGATRSQLLRSFCESAIGLCTLVLSGEGNLIHAGEPYGPIVAALRRVAPTLGSEPGSLGPLLRQRAEEAMLGNGRLLLDLCPALASFVPDDRPAEPLPPALADERMTTTLLRLFAALAVPERPIVLALSHIDAADDATLRLVMRLLESTTCRYLLIVATLSDGAHAAWKETLGPWLQKSGPRVDGVHLGPQVDAEMLARHAAVAFLPEPSRFALAAAACLGRSAPLDAVAAALGTTPVEAAARLAPAETSDLLGREGAAYVFADALAAQDLRREATKSDPARLAEMHLRIGAFLTRGMGEDEPNARLYEAAGHILLGKTAACRATLAPGETARLCAITFAAARRARSAGASSVAADHLGAAGDLLDGHDGPAEIPPDLTWKIRLAQAECAARRGDRRATEARVGELRRRARNELEGHAAARLLIDLHAGLGEHEQAYACAAACLAPLGVRLPERPGPDDVAAAFEATWDALGDRAIEEIADLEPMTNPEALAATAALFAVHPSAHALGPDVADIVACHLVRLSLLHGNAAASVVGHVAFGAALVGRRGDHRGGYRFGKVAMDLSEQMGSALLQGIVGACFATNISIWTHHLRASIAYSRRAHEAALSSGNTPCARRSGALVALFMLLKGDPLDDVAREVRNHEASRLDASDPDGIGELVGAIERFVAQQKGRAVPPPARRDDLAPEPHVDPRTPAAPMRFGTLVRRVLDLAALVLAGENDDALLVSASLRAHAPAFASQVLLPEERYFAALAEAGRRTPATLAARLAALDDLALDLERWADRCPENFQHKHALVLAERSRLAGRDVDAMRLYDQAIAAARDNGFTHGEAIAADAAVRFYVDRSFPTIAAAYLRLARAAYARWGAGGKVEKLDRRYAKLVEDPVTGTSKPPLRGGSSLDIDVLAAVQTAHAVSEEIVLQRLIVTLMRIVIEHGGAQRCHVLLATDGGELSHAGRALVTSQGLDIEVPGGRARDLSTLLPASVIGYVRRTGEPILLEDATAEPMFSADPYVARARPRSVLCMPITRQTKLIGIFYMENNLVPGAFTPRRLSLLEFLAAQAAISLDHAQLYADLARENSERRRTEQTLRRSEERMRRLVEIAGVIPWEADAETERFTFVGPQAEERLGWPTSAWYKPNFLRDHAHPEDRDLALAAFTRAASDETPGGLEYRLRTKDGRAVWLHMVVSVAEREGGQRLLSGFFFDVTARKHAEETLREQLEIIHRQREDIRTLSTPLLDVWDGVVAMPVLGALDESRAARAMEVLLGTIAQRAVHCAILDLTGVASVDAVTAEHLLRIVRAVELLGARALIVGIQPDVARTIVSLGIGLGRVETRASLKDALQNLRLPAPHGKRAAGKNPRWPAAMGRTPE